MAQRTVEAVLPHIHEVDRRPTQIWFHFFPLELADERDGRPRPAGVGAAARGQFPPVRASRLEPLVGTATVTGQLTVIVARAESNAAPPSLDALMIRDIAKGIGGDDSLLLGICAVGVMTLQQVGLEAFRASSGAVQPPQGMLAKAPAKIVAARSKSDSQGILGVFRGIRAQYTVTFDERRHDARFTVINQQHLTTASANDTRDYSTQLRGTTEEPIRHSAARPLWHWLGRDSLAATSTSRRLTCTKRSG